MKYSVYSYKRSQNWRQKFFYHVFTGCGPFFNQSKHSKFLCIPFDRKNSIACIKCNRDGFVHRYTPWFDSRQRFG